MDFVQFHTDEADTSQVINKVIKRNLPSVLTALF